MARKSRKNIVVEEVPLIREKVWRAALYIRLSVEFNSNRGDSLETQRQIMEAYITLCPDIEIVEVYTDNGVSGQTFDRAAFQRMLQDIEAGRVDCVVVKDLSRLGRNAIDTGFYLEKYFPLHGVRFIAVNDQYDSETAESSGNHLIVPLKNMINEAYAADISRKVAAQQRQAMRDGEYIGARPPYGYRKDPDNCHRLLVNEDTAPVVRQMFQWAADGVALNDMVKRLNDRNIITPSHYLASIGLISSQRLIGSDKWHSWTVRKMLTDEIYVGDLVQGKTRSVGRKQVRTAPEEWIVVRNTHEPLVSRELFDRAQVVRRGAADKYTQLERTPYTENILRGRIFCGCCGRPLNRHKNGRVYYYWCIANQRMGKGSCPGNNNYLGEGALFETIVGIIQKEAQVVIGNRLRLKQADRKIAEQKEKANQEIADLRWKTERNRALLAGLYENFVSGILTRAEYLELKEDYSNKISTAVERVQQLQEHQKLLERQSQDYTCLADRLAALDQDTTLSSRLVSELIERVIVNSPSDVTVHFRFENDFDQLMGVLGNE